MKKYAAVFPGQGSQSVGMFADFMDNEIVAKTYAEANEALGYEIVDDLHSINYMHSPEREVIETI